MRVLAHLTCALGAALAAAGLLGTLIVSDDWAPAAAAGVALVLYGLLAIDYGRQK